MGDAERAKYVHAERQPEEAEGGRLHPHTDRAGTDAVVLLNMGCCEFTFDLPNKCKAQQAKEAWCIDNGGHWAQKKDCQYWPLGEEKPSDKEAWRYGLGQYMKEPHHNLLRNRQCSACATARDESEGMLRSASKYMGHRASDMLDRRRDPSLTGHSFSQTRRADDDDDGML